MDKQLEEQLERVRELSARVEQLHAQLNENAHLIDRDRDAMSGSPLHEVRDFRTWRARPEHEHHERSRRGDQRRAEAADRSPRRRKRQA
jgi:hypothetical protein